MANSRRKCKHCKEYTRDFISVPGGSFCSMDHAVSFAQANQAAARVKLLAKSKRDKAIAEKSARAKHREDKERVKSKSKWLAELQVIFNQYIRLRDFSKGCISCDKPATWHGQWHASHYYSRGHSSFLRFNLWNVHKSCSVCNSHLSGNIEQYTPRLIEKIGQGRYDWLQANKSNIHSHYIDWIKKAIRVARKAVNREKRRLNNQKRTVIWSNEGGKVD